MPALAFSSNHCPMQGAEGCAYMGRVSDQNLINGRYPLPGVACSHVHACYPQSAPQFSGASTKAQSRATQGVAGEMESFLLDPETMDVRDRAFCTTDGATG